MLAMGGVKPAFIGDLEPFYCRYDKAEAFEQLISEESNFSLSNQK